MLKKNLIDKIRQELLYKEKYSYFDIQALCKEVLPLINKRKLKKFYKEIREKC